MQYATTEINVHMPSLQAYLTYIQGMDNMRLLHRLYINKPTQKET